MRSHVPVGVLLVASVVVAKTSPLSAAQVPSACTSRCANTLQVSSLCLDQYKDSKDQAACMCSGLPALPDDTEDCYGCLSGYLSGKALDSFQWLFYGSSTCAYLLKGCDYFCYDTSAPCSSRTVGCFCSEGYLQYTLDCTTCGVEQNPSTTSQSLLSNFNDLSADCASKGYAVPQAANPVPSPTGLNIDATSTTASSINIKWPSTTTDAAPGSATADSAAAQSAAGSPQPSGSSVVSSVVTSHGERSIRRVGSLAMLFGLFR